ncbi:uncharacterized protein TRAVEDRAFT_53139 [Trametes versicolor FP-101664 SS1]|uniref:uncharacterized protein n=1 Tax=Trametes versicolor (strain FP-101664) TaxID=717944 RepID=UPI0004622149|nr:uncharacterized protein TRAVEDRAFT_53139 [Trametes versicolor FP-101664 SS1]EIW52698.1 hypothetical protein TRAVEDRAFT_53139 [Trametes versicolor FP-101664 SS1]
MSPTTQVQADLYHGPQEGEIYTLRSVESQKTLCLQTDTTDVRAQGTQKSQKKVQRWRFFRAGSRWMIQEVETGLFLGVDERSLDANVIVTTCATSWMIVVDDEDTSVIRLVLPEAGHCIAVDEDGLPRLKVAGVECDARGIYKHQSWILDRPCEVLRMGAAEHNLQYFGTTGLVSSLLCLSSA